MKNVFAQIKKDRMLRKILKFFYENPTCIDTSENIAGWIGEEEEKVKEKLEFLVKNRILNKDSTYLTAGYSLSQEKGLSSKLSKLSKELKDG